MNHFQELQAFAFAIGSLALVTILAFYWLRDRNDLPEFEDHDVTNIFHR